MNNSIPRILTSESYICLVVGVDGVHLNVAGSAFNEENSLCEVALNCVVDDCNVSELQGLDARTSVAFDNVIVFDPSVVLLACAQNSVIFVLLYRVVLEQRVTSEPVFRDSHYTVLEVLLDLVHKDEGIGRNDFNAYLALLEIAAFDFAAVASVHPDAWTVYVFELYSEVGLSGSCSLGVNADS